MRRIHCVTQVTASQMFGQKYTRKTIADRCRIDNLLCGLKDHCSVMRPVDRNRATITAYERRPETAAAQQSFPANKEMTARLRHPC